MIEYAKFSDITLALDIPSVAGKKMFFQDEVLRYDKWDFKKGLNYLIGISEVGVLGSYNNQDNVGYIRTLEAENFYESDEGRRYADFLFYSEWVEHIWLTGDHLEFNPPQYYIDWAISKKIDIPWLGYAVDKGFFNLKKQIKTINADEELHPRTENNYLRLIMTLANEIEGFNPREPYTAAQLIIDATDTTIKKATIAGFIKRANEILEKDLMQNPN